MDKLTLYRKGATISLVLSAIVPLIILSDSLYPYIFSKSLFIRLVITTFLVFFSFYLYELKKKNLSLDVSRLKNPIFVLISTYVLAVSISTVLGVDSYTSFFGNVERGGGLLTLYYLFSFTAGSLILFRREDWLNFFKTAAIVGAIIAVDAIVSYTPEIPRPGGFFLGNPSFVAAYQLFTIFSSMIVLVQSKKLDIFWRVSLYLTIPIALISIFISQTRGVFLGVIAGLLALFLFYLKDKNEIKFLRKITPKGIKGIVLLLLIIPIAIFVFTRSSNLWDRIPLVNRIADISREDGSIQTRLINMSISVDSINPTNVGIQTTLFGWGPENYDLAHIEFYDPIIQRYSVEWFDKAHNIFLDELVTKGLVGVLIYLTVWIYILIALYKRWTGDFSSERYRVAILTAIFFAVAYFVQNLFLFDQVSMYIPIYAYFAYVIFEFTQNPVKGGYKHRIKVKGWLLSGTLVLTILSLYILYTLSFIPYMQMRTINNAYRMGRFEYLTENINKIMEPQNYAHPELVSRAFFIPTPNLFTPEGRDFAYVLSERGRPAFNQRKARPKLVGSIGRAYSLFGGIYSDERLLEKGVEEINTALELAPNRQDIHYYMASSLVAQGKFEEAINVINKAYMIEPDGANIDEYYLLIVFPYDFEDEYGTLEKFNKFFIEEVNPLNKERASWYRAEYLRYINSLIRKEDNELLEKVLRRAILMEEKFKEVNEAQLGIGRLSEKLITYEKSLKEQLAAIEKSSN